MTCRGGRLCAVANKRAGPSIAERKSLVESIFIKSPRFTRVTEMISHCHRHSKIAAEPECLLITGWQGTGKTTLWQDYARNFPRRINEGGVTVPVLATSIPVPATVKGLSTQLLWAMGDPKAAKGTNITQTLRLLGFAMSVMWNSSSWMNSNISSTATRTRFSTLQRIGSRTLSTTRASRSSCWGCLTATLY